VHSTYIRTISDLPLQKYKVKLVIKVKKYFCNNEIRIIKKNKNRN